MKKIFTLAVLVAATCFALPAQAQFKFGLKGGLNITDMSFSSDVVDASNRTGFFIGPTVKFTLPIVGLGIDASALYDQREAKVKGADKKLKQQAINIPINLRYDIGLGSLAACGRLEAQHFQLQCQRRLWRNAAQPLAGGCKLQHRLRQDGRSYSVRRCERGIPRPF